MCTMHGLGLKTSSYKYNCNQSSACSHLKIQRSWNFCYGREYTNTKVLFFSRNARGQTALHCVCQISHQKSPSALERRSYSVILLLSWRGPLLPTGERERVEVAAKDIRGNTALHYAAGNGLKRCVDYLVAHGADIFIENYEGLTPCDLAVRDNNHDIACRSLLWT